MAPCAVMSEQTFNFSFGKFLEQIFYNTAARYVVTSCVAVLCAEFSLLFFGSTLVAIRLLLLLSHAGAT